MLAVRSATRCAVNCVDDPPVLIGETTGAKGDSNLRRAPGRIRTCDTRFRRAVLYPLSYEGARPDYRPAPARCSRRKPFFGR
jgi:hypothetical protein